MRWILLILLLLPVVFAVDLAELNGYRVPSGIEGLFGNAVVEVQLTDVTQSYKIAEKQLLVTNESADYIVQLNIASTSLEGNIVPVLTQLYTDDGITVTSQDLWSKVRYWWSSKWFTLPTEPFELPIEEVVEEEIIEQEIEEEQTLTEVVEEVAEEVVEEVVEEVAEEEVIEENLIVEIDEVNFEPYEVTISAGDTIDFVNVRTGRWETAHLLGVREMAGVKSGDLEYEDRWSYTFTEAGRFQFVDMYITTMVLTIYVEE